MKTTIILPFALACFNLSCMSTGNAKDISQIQHIYMCLLDLLGNENADIKDKLNAYELLHDCKDFSIIPILVMYSDDTRIFDAESIGAQDILTDNIKSQSVGEACRLILRKWFIKDAMSSVKVANWKSFWADNKDKSYKEMLDIINK